MSVLNCSAQRVGGLLRLIALSISFQLWPAVAAVPAAAGVDRQLDLAAKSLQSGETDKAVRLLERTTRFQPRSSQAWRLLGTARKQKHQYDDAIAAWQRSLSIDPAAPQVLYSIGGAFAAKGDREQALRWLRKAHATRRYDMTQLSVDPDLAAFRSDPSFQALLPTPTDFARPFVESVDIHREWRGEAINEQFGWIARNLGDVDGDGVNDVVTSAPTHGDRESNSGRVYVFSTRSGRLLWTADGQPGDQMGSGLEAAGDTNGDGVPDVIASGPEGAGIARLYSGRDGQVLQSFHSSDPREKFGNHVAGVGDIDGDGCADILIGAPGKDGESKIAGRAYLRSGNDGRLLATFEGERAGDEFGSAVSGFSDGRGHFWLVVGAPGAGKLRHGRVYIYKSLNPTPAFVIEADASGDALGRMFVSVIGDLDADGVPDVYASDWSNSAKGSSTGRIVVHSGRTGTRLLQLTGEKAGEGFGTSPSVAGDVDGDGYADLIVGAWQNRSAAVSGGRAYLYSGRTGKLIKTFTDRVPGDTLGFDAVGLGDVDKDGTVDLLLTAGWSGVRVSKAERSSVRRGRIR